MWRICHPYATSPFTLQGIRVVLIPVTRRCDSRTLLRPKGLSFTIRRPWLDLSAVYMGLVVDRVAIERFMSNGSSLSFGLPWMIDSLHNGAAAWTLWKAAFEYELIILINVVLIKGKQLRKYCENTAWEMTTWVQGDMTSRWLGIAVKLKIIFRIK